MKTLQEIIKILSEHKEKLYKKYKIKKITIFGSYARGEQREGSDIDLIVDFEETPTFIDLLKAEREIRKLLGVKVDIITRESISPFIKPYIKEVEVI